MGVVTSDGGEIEGKQGIGVDDGRLADNVTAGIEGVAVAVGDEVRGEAVGNGDGTSGGTVGRVVEIASATVGDGDGAGITGDGD